jgi:hypothetical protein
MASIGERIAAGDKGGDHDPPHSFMVVLGHGFHVDLTHVSVELWDQNNVAACA